MKAVPKPLDAEALDRLALRYVERFATTRAKLAAYLTRKLRGSGWQGDHPPDVEALADRLAALGYIDDRAFGSAKASAMARRGLGDRRIAGALYQAGLDADDKAALAPGIAAGALAAAVTFARRRRIGPFASEPADRDLRRRQVAAMIRAGHDHFLARRIVEMAPGDDVAFLDTNP